MRDLERAMIDGGLEQRSGLPGLGGRPKLHPSWDSDRRDPVTVLPSSSRAQIAPLGIPSHSVHAKNQL
ncbi:MAG: hypothetical protein ACR2RE_26330 [Geminicoccaceae bacterium]